MTVLNLQIIDLDRFIQIFCLNICNSLRLPILCMKYIAIFQLYRCTPSLSLYIERMVLCGIDNCAILSYHMDKECRLCDRYGKNLF